MALSKSKRHASKSYPPMVEAVQDPVAVAKLEFFSFFASQIQSFHVAYQTDNPTVPFLCQVFFKLIRKIMQLIVKPNLLRKCESGQIDLLDKDIFLKCKYVISVLRQGHKI